jgi:type III secretion protein R
MMATSFLKFSVVFSILRSAMGTQQVPPTPVLMGLAVILTAYVMAPVAAEINAALQADLAVASDAPAASGQGSREILRALEHARPPAVRFLKRHAHPREVELFLRQARGMGASPWSDEVKEDDLAVLLPAFAVSELSEAFAIGFLLFLPFLVIDMVISNILLAMGMHMLSPTVVSLPFKLLLFVMIDGWALLTQGLLQAYLPH